VGDTDFVQENVPDDESLKIRVIAAIDGLVRRPRPIRPGPHPRVVVQCLSLTTADLKWLLEAQTRTQARRRPLEEWEERRDEFLLRIVELKRELLGDY
jgi:hypothetical protein